MAQLGQQQRDMADVSERVQRLENELRRQTELLDRFKEVQNWNATELQRWAEAALQREEDALTLALYQRQDEAKVKELNLKLERWAARALLFRCCGTACSHQCCAAAACCCLLLPCTSHVRLPAWMGCS